MVCYHLACSCGMHHIIVVVQPPALECCVIFATKNCVSLFYFFLKSVFVVFSFDHCSATMSNLNVCSCCHAVSTPFTVQNVLALVLKHVACLDMFVPQRVLPFSMSCLSFHSWQLLTVGQFHESANCFSHGS